MVRTRHTQSEEDATPEAQALDENGQPKAVTRALKKLLIDANPALRGEQEEKAKIENAPKKVYHWRGAVYEMTEETPQEWLDQEPARYQKRKRAQETRGTKESTVDATESEDEAPPPPKRKRGRPRKHPLPEHLPEAPRASLKRKRQDSPIRQSSRRCREEDSESPATTRKTRSQGVAEEKSKTARERAIEKGYQIESIPWADFMTGQIAVNLTKFCAIQSTLRKLMEEYQQAEAVHIQLLQAKEYETEKDGDQAIAPLTPEAENDIDIPERPDSGLSGIRRTSTPPRYDEFGPWDPPPRNDDRGRELHWSLHSARDMEGRAEYHIYTGKLNASENEKNRAQRITRELEIIKKWEKLDGGVALIHDESQARTPHRSSHRDGSTPPRSSVVSGSNDA